MFGDRRDRRRTARDDLQVVAKRICAEPWSPGTELPTVGEAGPICAWLTAEVVGEACDKYIARMRGSN